MLFVEDQAIKVSGVVLPGLVKSIEVKGEAEVEEQEVEGSSSKKKQATGFNDKKVTVELILDDSENQTKYEKLAVLEGIFQKPGQTVPDVHTLICEDATIRGVSKIIFKSLSHKRENKKGQIPVSLEFWEYNPTVIRATKGGTDSAAGDSNSGLTDEYRNYLDGTPAADREPPARKVNMVRHLPF